MYYYAAYREIFLRTYFRNIMNVLCRIAGFLFILFMQEIYFCFSICFKGLGILQM